MQAVLIFKRHPPTTTNSSDRAGYPRQQLGFHSKLLAVQVQGLFMSTLQIISITDAAETVSLKPMNRNIAIRPEYLYILFSSVPPST
jgi:hypothetical protein